MNPENKSRSDSSSSSSTGNLLADRLSKIGIGRGRGTRVPGGFDRQALLRSLSSKASSSGESAEVVIDTSKIVSDVGRGRARLLASLNPNIRFTNPGAIYGDIKKQDFDVAPLVQKTCLGLPATTLHKSIDVENVVENVENVVEEENLSSYSGTSGKSSNFLCNYIKLKVEPNKGVYEYEVKFNQQIDSKGLKIKLVNEHLKELGGVKTFDGVTLYLPILLDSKTKVFTSINPINDTPIEIQIIYKKKKTLGECVHLYNVLFRRIMNCLELVCFNRQHFDPAAAKIIPQHQLEIWPGYVTAVNNYEGGIMLCLDVSHRVLRQQTVLNLLCQLARSDKSNIIKNAEMTLVGSYVLTRYNNRSYRIDEIDFDKSPMSTFENSQGNKITFYDYYKEHYNIDIIDLDQPLLISKCSVQVSGYTEPIERQICLVPELTYLTGISEDMRTDRRIMRDIATYTRVTPNQRIYGFRKFLQNLKNNNVASELLSSWGLSLDDCCQLPGRTLEPESILFTGASLVGNKNASWGQECVRKHVLDSVNLVNWAVIYSKQDQYIVHDFTNCVTRCGPPMGIMIKTPLLFSLPNDKTITYINETHKIMQQYKGVQIIVYIFPTMRDDRYAAIKKLCCVEYGIASQVINTQTISVSDKLRSIVQKITLQVNCKLGGSLWGVNIPLKNTMICGIDTYHDPTGREKSVIGFVSSLNPSCTKYYSQIGFQSPGDELGQSMKALFQKSLQRYFEVNGGFPDKVICYRDGIGDGCLEQCKNLEILMIEECFNNKVFINSKPKLIYIIIQKRINTRIMELVNSSGTKTEYKNPAAGSIIDHTITRKGMFDFFLVPQNVQMGTVSPSHYIVLHDSSSMKPDHIQRLSFKMCHLYYNWPGTIRVPACCQYAHKLAFLIGQHVKSKPSRLLEDTLFYL